jgi:hypothetical protein
LKMEVQVDKKQNFLDPGLRKVSVKPRFWEKKILVIW